MPAIHTDELLGSGHPIGFDGGQLRTRRCQSGVIAEVANAEGGSPIIAPYTWVEIDGANVAPASDSPSGS